MGEVYRFDSPSVKFREKDLTRRSSRSEIVESLNRIPSGEHTGDGNGGGKIPDTLLQWVTGVMYNNDVLMYNYKVWTNDIVW